MAYPPTGLCPAAAPAACWVATTNPFAHGGEVPSLFTPAGGSCKLRWRRRSRSRSGSRGEQLWSGDAGAWMQLLLTNGSRQFSQRLPLPSSSAVLVPSTHFPFLFLAHTSLSAPQRGGFAARGATGPAQLLHCRPGALRRAHRCSGRSCSSCFGGSGCRFRSRGGGCTWPGAWHTGGRDQGEACSS